MSLTVDVYTQEAAIVMRCWGRIVRNRETDILNSAAERVLRADSNSIVMDLKGVRAIDGAGLGAIVALHSRAAAQNRKLILSGLQPNVRQLFALTRLDRVLSIDADSSRNVAAA